MARANCTSCGKEVYWSKATSRPKDQVVCRECRAQTPAPYGPRNGIAYAVVKRAEWRGAVTDCRTCGAQFQQDLEGRGRQRVYCSAACKNKADKRRDRSGWVRPTRICLACGEQYHITHGGTGDRAQRYCSTDCWSASRPGKVWPSSRIYPTTCSECGVVWCSRTKRKLCSAECQRKQNSRVSSARIIERYRTDPEFRDQVLAKAHARRADKLGLGSRQVLLSYLIERDRGVCGLCHRPVRAKRGPMRPSIDHIVPLSRGGTHELPNVQLSHYRCNLEKNNSGGGEQLLLIG